MRVHIGATGEYDGSACVAAAMRPVATITAATCLQLLLRLVCLRLSICALAYLKNRMSNLTELSVSVVPMGMARSS